MTVKIPHPLTTGKKDGRQGVFVAGNFIPLDDLTMIAEAYVEGRVYTVPKAS